MTLTKKRNPFISSFLSLLVPGLGQLYNGEHKKAMVIYLAQFVVILLPFATGLQYTPRGLFLIFGIIVLFYFFVMGEATFRSLRKKSITLKPYNKWYLYLLIVVLANGLSSSVNALIKNNLNGIKPFYLPTSSNEPTLYPGDRIIVDLRKKTPVKGTFIVFKSAGDPETDFVKRVIATRGELLEIKNKKVFVNNTSLKEPYSVHGDTKNIPGTFSPRDNFGPIRIPDGKVFVMGDNRDNSFDSRFFGPIDETSIIGTALYIYWSRDKHRIGMRVQ